MAHSTSGSPVVPHVVVPCGIWHNIYRASDTSRKKSKISRDFQVQIRGKIGRFRGKKVKIHGKIGRFRGIFAGEKSKFRKIGRFRGILAEKSQISKDFQGQILRKIGRFYGKFRQETISKKQPILLDCFWQISLKSINFASI